MPRPKGSKKDKNKLILKSLSRSSIQSPLLSSQTSLPLLNINNSNDAINNDINYIQSPIINTVVNKNSRLKKNEFVNGNDDHIITTDNSIYSSSEIHGGRVVINPAVLRYLEQNRNINYSTLLNKTHHRSDEYFNKNTLININDEKDDYLFDDIFNNSNLQESFLKYPSLIDFILSSTDLSNTELFELDKLRENDLFLDLTTYSTDFLASAELAQWILTHK